MALIRRLQRSTAAHHLAAQNVQKHSRSYTTIAQEFITGAEAPRAKAETDSTTTALNLSGERVRRKINEILHSKDHSGFHDELWQNYQDLLECSQALLPQELIGMLRRLVLSERTLDFERALALFESIPIERRRAIHYSYAVSAALALKDIDTAVFIHREALLRINGSVGTAAILGYAIQQGLWTVAVDIWHHFWENKLSYYTRPDIWTVVDGLPLDELIHQASSAADFALKISESLSGKEALAAREFALELIRHAFSIVTTDFNIKSHWKLVNKARLLDAADCSVRTMALQQLLSFDSREHEQLALHLYRLLRKRSNFSPTRRVLEAVTRKIFRTRSAPSISMILDDWRSYFATTPARYASIAVRVFAWRGCVEEIQRLFNDYVSDHGKPEDESFYNNILLAYSRRADTEGIMHCFNHLQETYDFKPGVEAWNCVIATFARVGDIDGVLIHLRKLRDAGIQPNSTTYFLLMSTYGRRGDREAVYSLYEQSKADGVATTMEMADQVVLVNVKDGNLEEAERLAEQAPQTDADGSRTFMWNVLLGAYAIRKDVEKVGQLHRRMRTLGIPFDEMTYAALMTSLTVIKFPDGARKILFTIMPRYKVKPTALHYAILMRGYYATRQYKMVFELYERMQRSSLNPNMSTQNVLLRVSGSVDKEELLKSELRSDELELPRARRVFEKTLASLNPTELAPTEPRMFVGANPLNEAFSSTYFEYLVFLYGTENAFNKASELYERYIAKTVPLQGHHQDDEFIPPVRLLSALMVSLIRQGKHSEVDRCWNLVLEKSEKLACKSKADTFRGQWVLHSRRFIINLPLHQYIRSLKNQDRIADLIDTVRDLIHAGYALNSSNWNKYIQALARSPQLTHRDLALRLCEQQLVDLFPGWGALGDPYHMKQRLHRQQRHMLLIQEEKAPTYVTLVLLARAYVVERRGRGLAETKRRYKKLAPKTLNAIENMPRVDDKEQTEILRQETW